MANGKKSFVLYADLLTSVDHLTDEELGRLFRHTLEYVNDLDPVLEDRLLVTAWKPIERSLKSDLKKWEEIRKKRAEAGAKGGKQKVANQANAKSAKQKVANQAVSVTVSDSVNVNDIYRAFAHLSITTSEYDKLKENWSKQQIDNTLDDIENFKANKKYVSLYLTCRKWLNKNYPIKQQSEATELTDLQMVEQAQARNEEYKKSL